MSVKEEAPSIRTYPHFVKRASYEQFLELTKGLEARYEYIDGAIYLQASPKTPHQVAVTELLVQFYMSTEGTECRPFVAPYDITLKRSDKDVNVVQPDLMIICDLDEHLADDGYYKGVPQLVVEILSDGTARFDLIKKFDLYMSCGVSEYWVVDPEEQIVFIYGFEDGKLIQQSTYKATGKAKSMVFPDLAVELARFFRCHPYTQWSNARWQTRPGHFWKPYICCIKVKSRGNSREQPSLCRLKLLLRCPNIEPLNHSQQVFGHVAQILSRRGKTLHYSRLLFGHGGHLLATLPDHCNSLGDVLNLISKMGSCL